MALQPTLIHSIDKFSTAEKLEQWVRNERTQSQPPFNPLQLGGETTPQQPSPLSPPKEGIYSPQQPSSDHPLTPSGGGGNKVVDILIEVNTSGEASKNGVEPEQVSELIKQINDLEFVRVRGLMTIGALTEDEKIIRKCFVLLRELFEKEKAKNPPCMEYLSMGMSGDFKIAIQEGANIIRLGSVIFGERQYR
jgi:uncharacterized pyridoxal phosphate-containing UPF0001 family protein